jgi:hypothetical protein
VSIAEAEAEHRQLAARLAALPRQVVPARKAPALDAAALLRVNLVSGVVSAHDPPGEPPHLEQTA